MTYCVAIEVDEGIVFAADTRTNAGVDYVTSYRKLHVFRPADDRVFVLLSAGSPATTRELVDQIGRDLDDAPNQLVYFNLPKLHNAIENSNLVKMYTGAEPELKKLLDAFMTEEYLGVGWATASTELEEGTRSTAFGPHKLSGPLFVSGIVAAIAIPNLLNAIDRGKQKRTMADIHTIGVAMESYAIDTNRYPETDGWVEVDAIASELEPVYIRTLPRVDGWGRTIYVWSDGQRYVFASFGKDGDAERDWSVPVEPRGTSTFNGDIVFSDGSFVQFPQGTQQ